MDIIWEGIKEAFRLIGTGDPEIFSITWLTLQVSGIATLLSIVIGIPLGTLLGLTHFPGRKFLLSVANASMGLPPVVVGLWVTIFLWRSGPFGFLNIMYTPTAIIIAQAIIASPVIIALTAAALQQTSQKIRMQIHALGATKTQYLFLLLGEIRLSILAAIIAGFGAIISEVGASMAVGGNYQGLFARADHRHRARGIQRQFRRCYCAQHHTGHTFLFHHSAADASAAKAEVSIMLQAENITWVKNKKAILNGVSLEIKKG